MFHHSVMQEMKLESIKRLNGKPTTNAGRRGEGKPPSTAPSPQAGQPVGSPASHPGPEGNPSGSPQLNSQAAAASERAAMLRRRATFESRPENCGEWERAFPCADGAAAKQYSECMVAARDAYESHHSCRLRAHLNSLAARHDHLVRVYGDMHWGPCHSSYIRASYPANGAAQAETSRSAHLRRPRPSPEASPPPPVASGQRRTCRSPSKARAGGTDQLTARRPQLSTRALAQEEPGESDGETCTRGRVHPEVAPTAAAEPQQKLCQEPPVEPTPPRMSAGESQRLHTVTDSALKAAAGSPQAGGAGYGGGLVSGCATVTRESDGVSAQGDKALPQGVDGSVTVHSLVLEAPAEPGGGGDGAAVHADVIRPLPPACDLGRLHVHAARVAAPGSAAARADGLAVCGLRLGHQGGAACGPADGASAAAEFASAPPSRDTMTGLQTAMPAGGVSDAGDSHTCPQDASRHPLAQLCSDGVFCAVRAVACCGCITDVCSSLVRVGGAGEDDTVANAARLEGREPITVLQHATVPGQLSGGSAAAAGTGDSGDAVAVRGTCSLERVVVRGRRPARKGSPDPWAGRVHASVPSGARNLWGRGRDGSEVSGRLQAMHRELVGAAGSGVWRSLGSLNAREGVPPRAQSMAVPWVPKVALQAGRDDGQAALGRGVQRSASLAVERFGGAPVVAAGGLAGRRWAARGSSVGEGGAALPKVLPWALTGAHGAARESGLRGRKAEAPRDAVVRLLCTAAQRDGGRRL